MSAPIPPAETPLDPRTFPTFEAVEEMTDAAFLRYLAGEIDTDEPWPHWKQLRNRLSEMARCAAPSAPEEPATTRGLPITPLEREERQQIMLAAGVDITSPHRRIHDLAIDLARYEATVRAAESQLAALREENERLKAEVWAHQLGWHYDDDNGAWYESGEHGAALMCVDQHLVAALRSSSSSKVTETANG